MKTIITGGNGLIGKYLQQILDGVYLGKKDFDLTKIEDVIKMYETHTPDNVIHLAARVGGIADNIKYPLDYYEENIIMNTNVVKYARIFNVKKLVSTLSSCAYPDYSEVYPMNETFVHNGIPYINNLGYGYAKRMMGVHIGISKRLGYNYSYIIPSNLYGEYESGDTTRKHFIGSLLDKINDAIKNSNNHITLFGDGTPLRQFTFAKDVAEIIKMILDNDVKEDFNVTTPENLSVDEMARIALRITNSEHLEIRYDNTKPNGQYRKDIDDSKFYKIFPDYKFTSYHDGLRRTYKSLIGE